MRSGNLNDRNSVSIGRLSSDKDTPIDCDKSLNFTFF